MLVLGFPAEAFGTNCYVLAPADGGEAVIVDPGIDVVPRLDEVLADHRLRPVAVLLTHGHLDHTFSAAPVCAARSIPAYLHPGDRHLLADPMKAFPTEGQILFGGRGGYDSWSEPADVRPLQDGGVLQLAGLDITVVSAPGHSEGSVMFRLDGDGSQQPICLTGDALFCGSIGRTDLPGGDHPTMLKTLVGKVLSLPDEMLIYPGHGPDTEMRVERVTNPYLLQVAGENPFAADGPGLGL